MFLYFLIDDILCTDYGLSVVEYVGFLSDGLQITFNGISFETLCITYVSLLWNYGILKA